MTAQSLDDLIGREFDDGKPAAYRIAMRPGPDTVERLYGRGSPMGTTWGVYHGHKLIADFAEPDDAVIFVNAKRFIDEVLAQRRLTITDAGRMLLASTTKEPPT